MKYLLVILLSISLAGCGSPLTRLLPKLEKLEVDPDLMKPPQELKIIVKPDKPPQPENVGDAGISGNPVESTTVVTPKGQ